MSHFTSTRVVPHFAMKAKKTSCTYCYNPSVGNSDRTESRITDTHGILFHSETISTGLDLNSKVKKSAGDLGQPCLMVQWHRTLSTPHTLHSFDGEAISYFLSSKEYSYSRSLTKSQICWERGKSRSHLLLEEGNKRPLTHHEKWNIFCHISKQRMSQSSEIVTLQCELVSSEETQNVKIQDTSPR